MTIVYELLDTHDSTTLLDALDACSYARPALLNLGSGPSGIGAAGLRRGFLVGVADDWTHFGPLGIVKMCEQLATLFIIDCWPTAAAGVLAVRRFELRIAENESFSDGVVDRGSFLEGFLRESGTLLTAEERDDLLHLFVSGIGTDDQVIPDATTRNDFRSMIEDLVYISCTVKGLSINTVKLKMMQKTNHRCGACLRIAFMGVSCLCILHVCILLSLFFSRQILRRFQAPLLDLLQVQVQQVPRVAASRGHDPRVGNGLELLDGGCRIGLQVAPEEPPTCVEVFCR